MRTLSVAALAEIAIKRGTEPITVVEIDWTGILTGTYCTAQGYESIDDRLISVSALDYGVKLSGSGTSATMSIDLDDTDGTIKALLDADDAYLRPVRVYQSFRDILASEKFLVFEGVINSPIKWDEDSRVVSLALVTMVEDGEYGFTPEEGDFDCLAPSAVGKAWPLAYGTPIRCQASLLTEAPNGIIQTAYRLITLSDLRSLHAPKDEFDKAELDKLQLEADFPDLNAQPQKSVYDIAILVYEEADKGLKGAIDILVNDEPPKETDLNSYVTEYATLRDGRIALALAEQDAIDFAKLIIESDKVEAQLTAELAIENGQPNPQAAVVAQYGVTIAAEAAKQIVWAADIVTLNTVTIPALEAQEIVDIGALRLTTEDLIQVDFTTITVENGECFPQTPTASNCVINDTVIAGLFANTRFLRTSGFNRLYNNITFDTRLNSQPNEFWITGSERIKGMYVLINRTGAPSYSTCFVTEQIGSRCFFEPPLYTKIASGEKEPFLPASGNGHIEDVCGVVIPSWLDKVMTEDEDLTGFSKLPNNDWEIRPGDTIRLNTTFTTKYVANAIPSTTIHEVLAYRTDDSGRRRLSNVPSEYFTYDLNELIAGQNATTITLQRPLSFFSDEDWEDDIYVTLTSSVGPNPADILEDLIDRYSNTLSFNAASKAALFTALTKYPMHFCTHKTGNVLSLINELCWQARCGAFVEAAELFVKYLAFEEAPVFTLDVDNIQLQSASMELTKTEALVTKLTADWKVADADFLGLGFNLEYEVTIRNNIPIYGEFEKRYDFFAYNIESLVLKGLLFWAIRYSMIWNYIEVSAHLDTLELQLYDTITVTTSFYTGLAVVDRISYDLAKSTVSYRLWTPLRSGESTPYAVAWPSSTPGSTAWPTIDDPYVIIGDTNGN